MCQSKQTEIFLKRWEYQITILVSWKTYMQVKKQQLEPDMEQVTGSKLGKENDKAVCCHLAYFTYIESVLFFFSCSLVSDSLWLRGLEHTRLPCPSLSPRGWSNPCPLSQWCHPTISSSVVPFSSCLQSFPASRSFPMSQLFASVQFSSVAQSCPILCDPMNKSTPGLPVHNQLPESTQTQVQRLVMPFNHLILCHPLHLLPSIFPSIRVFSNESTLRIRWPKYWSFIFSISPSNEHPGLISFRMD